MKNTFLFSATTGLYNHNLLMLESGFDSVEIFLQDVIMRLAFLDGKIKNNVYTYYDKKRRNFIVVC